MAKGRREVEKKEWQKPREMKKKRVKREEEKEENRTGTAKRSCEGCFSVAAFEIFSQERDLGSCGDISWEDLLEEHEDLSGREPVSGGLVRVVLDVTDVLVFTFVCGHRVLCCFLHVLGSGICEIAVLFFLQKTCTLLYRYARRGEVRRLTSESALRFQEEG